MQHTETTGTNKKARFCFFHGHRNAKTGFLSNWYPCEFKDAIYTYSSVEQYMMSQKAWIMGDEEQADKIMGLSDPKAIKAAGRKVRNFDQKIWNEHKIGIVSDGLYLKFSQNPNLLKRLLDLEAEFLAEASPYDKIWGIGLEASHHNATKPKLWPGQNLLGQCLMAVRQRLIYRQDFIEDHGEPAKILVGLTFGQLNRVLLKAKDIGEVDDVAFQMVMKRLANTD